MVKNSSQLSNFHMQILFVKDDMIRNMSDVLLGIFGDMSNGVLTLIEEEESELDLM